VSGLAWAGKGEHYDAESAMVYFHYTTEYYLLEYNAVYYAES
jgi:hypothetical protein